MTRSGNYFRRLLILTLGVCLLCATASWAQEAQRHFNGQFITGFSGLDVSGDKVQSPYAGFNADLSGYVSDPRILTYELNPTFVKGFEWAGPMAGPDSNGINANSTFLGGSRIPIHFFFSRQNIPTPDLPQGGVNYQGLSRNQQDLGVDWSINLRHLPVFNLHYSRDDYTADYPKEVGGNVDSGARMFRLDGQYEIAKWQLNGNFINQNNSAETLGLLSVTGEPLNERVHDRGVSFAASRPLPEFAGAVQRRFPQPHH